MMLHEALLGGPGLDGYAYNAAIYCKPCGQSITRKIFADRGPEIDEIDARDSEQLPQPIFFGEHEIAQHCDKCGAYCYGTTEANS